MNILKHFRREAPVEATTDDVLDDLRAEETRKREQAAREQRQNEEYRARITKGAKERLAQMNANLDELGALIPRLVLALGDFDRIVAEINREGLGYEATGLLEDIIHLPPDFALKLRAAINDAAPDAVWDYSATGPGNEGKKAERPKTKVRMVDMTGGFPNAGPPPGFVGAWDMLHDRPFEEPGPLGPVLPF